MMIDLSVIIPCFNEEDNVRAICCEIEEVFKRLKISGEIVFIDDKSTDLTLPILLELEKEFNFIRVVAQASNQGIARAWLSGATLAKGKLVSVIDADFQYLPQDIARLYREYKRSHFDIIQGYRSAVGRVKDLRYIQSIVLNFILNKLFKMKLTDNKSGFFVCKKSVLIDILRSSDRYHFYQTFIMVVANSKGYSIKEIEILFQNRRAGKSFLANLPIWTIFRVIYEILKAVAEFRLSKHRRTQIADILDRKKISYQSSKLRGWRRVLWQIHTIAWPLHSWSISRSAIKYYYELEQSQYFSKQEIREVQDKKLADIIQHAYQHVDYYRDLFDQHGILPEEIKTVADLAKLPLLTKNDIRQNVHFGLLSDNHNKSKVRKINTSGSTGEPMTIYVDDFQLEMRWAASLRSAIWTGWQFGDKQARLWHQKIGMTRLQVFREHINALINRRLFIPAYELSNENLQKWIQKLEDYQPVLIDGYAESFNFLAYYQKNCGFARLKPKAIISSAQELPLASREIIEQNFGCRVYDKYGSREFSGIAYEADVPGEHVVVSENYIVEIVDMNGQPVLPGGVGEILITDLNNRCMPLIRYRIGDLARAVDNDKEFGTYPGLMRLGSIEGRTQAIIVAGNGRYLPGTFFAHFFKDYDHIITHYQIIQEKIGEINLNLVKGIHFTDKLFQDVFGQLKVHLGEESVINVEFVEHIPMGKTGKRQGSISRLNFDDIKQNLKIEL